MARCSHGRDPHHCDTCYSERLKNIAKESNSDKLFGFATHQQDQWEAENRSQGKSSSGGMGCWLMSMLLVIKAIFFVLNRGNRH